MRKNELYAIGFIIGLFLFWFASSMLGQIEVVVPDNKPERTLVHSYNNSIRKNYGNGKHSFTYTMRRSHKTEKDANNIYRIAGLDTIAFSLNTGTDKYSITNNGVGKFSNINNKKIEYDFKTKYDINIDGDTLYFKDGGKVKARMLFSGGWYNDLGQKIPVTKRTKIGKKVSFEFTNNITYSQSDSFVWTPTTEGNDTFVDQTVPDGTGNSGTLLYMLVTAGGLEDHILIEFPGLVGSIPAGAVIDSAFLSITCYANGGASQEIFGIPLAESFAEATATWNNKPDSISVITYNTDTLTSSGNVVHTWDIKRSVVAFVDFTLPYFGWEFYFNNVETQWNGRPSENGSDEPSITVYYTYGGVFTMLALDINSIECTIDTTGLTKADSFIILNATDSSAMGIPFTTTIDSIDTLTGGTEYIFLAKGWYNTGSDSFYTNKDTITTTSSFIIFTATAVNESTITFVSDTTGVGLFDSIVIADASSGFQFRPFKTELKDTIDTLSINTLYDFQAQVYNNNNVYGKSNIDSIYSDAVAGNLDSLQFLSDSSFFFIMNSVGNPSWTLFALIDSQRVNQGSTNVYVAPGSTKWLSSAPYKTFSELGGVTGDTIILEPHQLSRGDTIKMFIETVSGDSVANNIN